MIQLELDIEPTPEYLMEKVQECSDQIDILFVERRRLEELATSICPHTSTETTGTYSEGGYDYRASTRYVERCLTCRKVLSTKTVEHSYFG